jgi:hypothetical protein
MYVARVLIVIVSCILISPVSYSDEPPIIGLKVSAVCSKDNVQLDLELKNLTIAPIDIGSSNLPWGIRSSITLLVTTKGATPKLLKPALYVDDPGPGTVTIPANGVLKGRVALSRRFPELISKLKQDDLIVWWSYETILEDGVSTPRLSGSELLQRSKCIG